ncbi:MAG: hypothetical protein AB7O24_10065 [Kofleriaceae bacterium]
MNRLAVNRLAVNRLAVNRLAVNRLAVNRLALNAVSAGELVATPEGRELLSYVVSCAVPEGQTLVAEHDGTTFDFLGELGLAPEWLDRKLTDKGKGWISACLFARVNNHDVSVPISMRGPHDALDSTEAEQATWSVEEGAFYGNLFTPADEPIKWFACRGAGQATGETGGLVERDCTEPDPANPGKTLCGFTYAGDCGDFAAQHACKKFDEDGLFYEQCKASSMPERRGTWWCGGDDDDDHDWDWDWDWDHNRGNGHGNGHGGSWGHGWHWPWGWGWGWWSNRCKSSEKYLQVITTYVTP